MQKSIKALIFGGIVSGLLFSASSAIYAAEPASVSWAHWGDAANEFCEPFVNITSPAEVETNQIQIGGTVLTGIVAADNDIHRVIAQNNLLYCDTRTNDFNINGNVYTVTIPYGEDAFSWVDGNLENTAGWEFLGWTDDPESSATDFMTGQVVTEDGHTYYACYSRSYRATFSNTPADNASACTAPAPISLRAYYNGARQWFTGGNNPDAPSFVIPSFTGTIPTQNGIEAVGFEDEDGNVYTFGSTYTFDNNNRDVSFHLFYGTKYTVHFDIESTGTVNGTIAPDDAWVVEYTGTGGAKRYRDSFGNEPTGLYVTLPSPTFKNKDGYGVNGWISDNGALYTCGAQFSPTEQETTLRVHWNTFIIFGNGCNGYGAEADLSLAPGDYYVCYTHITPYSQIVTKDNTLTSVSDNVTYEVVDSLPNVNSNFGIFRVHVADTTGTMHWTNLHYSALSNSAVRGFAFPICEGAHYPYANIEIGGGNISGQITVEAGDWLLKTHGAGTNYEYGAYYTYTGVGTEYTSPAGTDDLYPTGGIINKVYHFSDPTTIVTHYLSRGNSNGLGRIVVIAPYYG